MEIDSGESHRVRGRGPTIGPVWRSGGGLGYPCRIYYLHSSVQGKNGIRLMTIQIGRFFEEKAISCRAANVSIRTS